ncbi:MAG TPA: DNA internalization-related competence protein ComEC/Rec2 [Candidatus Binataceae bacterium]
MPARISAARWLVDFPPLYVATIALVAGDALGNAGLYVPIGFAIALALAAAAAYLCTRPEIGVVIAFLAIGAGATLPVHDLKVPPSGPATLLRFVDDSRVTIEGEIVREPERTDSAGTYLYVRVERAGTDAVGNLPATPLLPATGLVRVTVRGDEHFTIGDEIRLASRIRFPRNDGDQGEFDYRGWLLRNGIAATMFADEPKSDAPPSITVIGHHGYPVRARIQALRERIGAFIDANLSYPKNAEMRALIIGDRSGIDDNIRQRFALTGMAHVLVISGLHLGFVAAAAFFLVRLAMGFFPTLAALGTGNKFAAAGAAFAALGYTSIAGGHVSTLRALIMVLAYAIAILIDRSRELLASVALAALIICFALPGSTADIGFQLSFAAVLVILIGMRRFAAWWRARFRPTTVMGARSRVGMLAEAIAGYVAVSFWALLGTAPLTAFHFNQFSLVGLVANAVVVPIMGFGAVICGLAAAALSFLSPTAARPILLLAGSLAGAGNWLAGWFEGWPLAWTRIFTPTIFEIAIAYGFVAIWCSRPFATAPTDAPPVARYVFQIDFSRWRLFAVAALGLALVLDVGWWTYDRFLCPDLRVTFLSVGEGDAAVVRFPGGRVMLIDGGGSFGGTFDPGERLVAPFLWANKIMHVDYAVVSHPDRDHFGGLIFLVHNFSPIEFWTSGVPSPDVSYQELLEAVHEAHARSSVCSTAAPSRFIGDVAVACLWPVPNLAERKENNQSMVLRLTWRDAAILFMGDIEAKGERELIATAANLRAAIIKVPHHGSATSSSPALIAAAHPQLAIVSVGYHNRFHFPSAAVIDRYRESGATVLMTSEAGQVSVDVGRGAIAVQPWRGESLQLPIPSTPAVR